MARVYRSWFLLLLTFVILGGSAQVFSYHSHKDSQQVNLYERLHPETNDQHDRVKRRAGGGLETFFEHLVRLGLNKICLLLRTAQIDDVLLSTGAFTLFAPTDEAFALLPGGALDEIEKNPEKLKEFLLYHIIPGQVSSSQFQNDVTVTSLQGMPLRFNVYITEGRQTYSVSGGQILSSDHSHKNSIVHKIDRVLYPIPSTDVLGQTKWAYDKLYRLIVTAGLDKRLSDGTYTLFVPTDDAFKGLSPVVQDALLKNVTLLQNILLNHVIIGSVYTTGLYDGLVLKSLGGMPLKFNFRRGLILVNGIPIVEPDVPVINGVIHVVNRVIAPKEVLEDCHCLSVLDDSKTPQSSEIQEPLYPSGPKKPFVTTKPIRTYPTKTTRDHTRRPIPTRPQRISDDQQVYDEADSYPSKPSYPFQTSREHPQRSEIPFGQRMVPTKPYPQDSRQQFTTHQPIKTTHHIPATTKTQTRPSWKRPPPQPQPEPPSRPKRPPPPRRPPQPQPEPDSQTKAQTLPYRPEPSKPLDGKTTYLPSGTSRPSKIGRTEKDGFQEFPGKQGKPTIPGHSEISTGQPGPHRRPGQQGTGYPERPGQQETGFPGRTWQSETERPGQVTGYPDRPGHSIIGFPDRPGQQVTGYPTRPGQQGTGYPTRPGQQGTGYPIRPGQQETGYPIRPGQQVTLHPGRPGQQVTGYPGRPGQQVTGYPGRPGQRVTGYPDRPGQQVTGYPDKPDQEGKEFPERPGQQGRRFPERPGQQVTGYPDRPGQPGRGFTERPGQQVKGYPSRPGQGRFPERPGQGRFPERPGQQITGFPERPEYQGRFPERPGQQITGFPERTDQPGYSRFPGQFPGTAQPQHVPDSQKTHQTLPYQPDSSKPYDQKHPTKTTPHFPAGTSRPGKISTPKKDGFQGFPGKPGRPGFKPGQETWNIQPDSRPRQPDTWNQTFTGRDQEPIPRRGQPTFRPGQTEFPEEPTGQFPLDSSAKGDEPQVEIVQTVSIFDVFQRPELIFKNQPISLTIIYELFKQVGIIETLQPGPKIIFVPSDEAINSLPEGTLQQLRNDPDLLHQILLYHVITVPPPPGKPDTTYSVRTAQGIPILIRYGPQGQIVQVDGADVITSTKTDDDYIIYVITRLLTPLPKPSINSYLNDRRDIYRYFSYLVKNRLDDLIKGPELYTLFLPLDDAFEQIPREQLEIILNNKTLIEELLLNHVVSGVYYTNDLRPGQVISGLRGKDIRFQISPNGVVKVNNVDIVEPDIVTGNGVIHVVDGLIYRPEIVFTQQKDTDTTIVSGEVQRPFTFETGGEPNQINLPETSIVQIPGVANRPFPGGSIKPQPKHEVDLTIVDVLQRPDSVFVNQPFSLNIIYELFQRAGIINILSRTGPFTIFLPVDKSLSGPEFFEIRNNPELLREVLLYHIITATLPPTDSRTTYMVTTAGGKPVLLTYDDQGNVVLVDGVEVITSAVSKNGLIYVISKPLHPLPKASIIEYFRSRQDLSRILNYLIQARIERTFQGPDPFTFFVPSDEAFNRLPQHEIQQIISNRTVLENFIMNHVVSGIHYTKELMPNLLLPTPRGSILRIDHSGDKITVNDANIIEGDITTGTGVIHIIDRVITSPSQEIITDDREPVQSVIVVPPSGDLISSNVVELAKGMGLNKFVHWLIQTDLIKVVQDGNRYTIFAPTDEAIESLPGLEAIERDTDQLRAILKYHIIPLYIQTGQIENERTVQTLLEGKEIRFNIYQDGRVYTASGAPFAPSNNPGNVLIAVVDRVLFPPQGNVYTTLTKLPMLGQLRQAVERIALDEDLRGQGPFTFFAPSDKAFENLSFEEKQRLMNNPQSILNLLKRHLVKGNAIYTSGVIEGMTLRSEAGDDLTVTLKPTCIAIDGVNVAFPDISTTNGVIHIVDHFL